MPLKEEAEEVNDKAGRIVRIMSHVARNRVDLEDNPDLALPISPEIRAEWLATVSSLKGRIKLIVSGW